MHEHNFSTFVLNRVSMCRKLLIFFFISHGLLCSNRLYAQTALHFDVVVAGGSASGVAAGISSSRLQANTLVLEEGPWLGGMLTAAGVSAFDGNHRLAGGIFAEFRDSLYQYYGGPAAVETGWVSNTLFEPRVGNRIFQNMAARESYLQVWQHSKLLNISFSNNRWAISVLKEDKLLQITANVVIDATELGDVAAFMNIPADIGMDSGPATEEPHAPETANQIVQDLTWVAILQEYPTGTKHILPKPPAYNPELFRCACDTRDPSTTGKPLLDCKKMMDYGRLPNGKYMINWPNCGNDIYLNIIDLPYPERQAALNNAKQRTLEFIYYLQHEIGFSHLGLSLDEFPSADGLPLIPYHRESRRIRGRSRLKVQHILQPFDQTEAYYKTGIAVGDYPIDHHHKQNPQAPPIDFINIKAPSYNIPLGALIPSVEMPLIIAEKNISVSNIVNGTTRLQPVVLGIGQAAGTLAALAANENTQPAEVSVRKVQQSLLDQRAYIMPYIDVPTSDPQFQAIQRIGATGLLKGTGMPYKWANQTWFYPDSLCKVSHLSSGLAALSQAKLEPEMSQKPVTAEWLTSFTAKLQFKSEKSTVLDLLNSIFPKNPVKADTPLSRRQVAIVLDEIWQPFAIEVDFQGHFIEENK